MKVLSFRALGAYCKMPCWLTWAWQSRACTDSIWLGQGLSLTIFLPVTFAFSPVPNLVFLEMQVAVFYLFPVQWVMFMGVNRWLELFSLTYITQSINFYISLGIASFRIHQRLFLIRSLRVLFQSGGQRAQSSWGLIFEFPCSALDVTTC